MRKLENQLEQDLLIIDFRFAPNTDKALLLITPKILANPGWQQLMALGFTVLLSYAVEFFQKPELVQRHRLANPVSETLYLGTSREKFIPNRVRTVIAEANKWL